MKKTYQPFIIEKANEILDILKEDVIPSDHAREKLYMLLTQKFINGKLNADDDISMVFDSEEEILGYINDCVTYENLLVLIDKGLVGMYNDDNDEEFFFLTESGKLYVESLMKI
jgi:hypothetical protein